jgi:hypothetical protein
LDLLLIPILPQQRRQSVAVSLVRRDAASKLQLFHSAAQTQEEKAHAEEDERAEETAHTEEKEPADERKRREGTVLGKESASRRDTPGRTERGNSLR